MANPQPTVCKISTNCLRPSSWPVSESTAEHYPAGYPYELRVLTQIRRTAAADFRSSASTKATSKNCSCWWNAGVDRKRRAGRLEQRLRPLAHTRRPPSSDLNKSSSGTWRKKRPVQRWPAPERGRHAAGRRRRGSWRLTTTPGRTAKHHPARVQGQQFTDNSADWVGKLPGAKQQLVIHQPFPPAVGKTPTFVQNRL